MLITNMIDKSRLAADGGGAWGGEGSTAWRARLVLFLGFALMAGGLAGSLVRPHALLLSSLRLVLSLDLGPALPSSCEPDPSPLARAHTSRLLGPARPQTTLIIKYILPAYPSEFTYYGIAAVGQNAGIMLSSVTLWIAQMAGDSEYECVRPP